MTSHSSIAPENRDTIVDGELRLEVERVGETVSEPDNPTRLVLIVSQDENRIELELEVTPVNRFGGFHHAEILCLSHGRNEQRADSEHQWSESH